MGGYLNKQIEYNLSLWNMRIIIGIITQDTCLF